MTIVTIQMLTSLAPQGNREILSALVAPMNVYFPRYGITSPMRVAQFLAQAAEETDGFKTLVEYASGNAYEGRKDLGNTVPGDGVRFKGRGIFQITGRSNYAFYGSKLGIDLVGSPEKAAEPDVAVQIAAAYWNRFGLNAWADRDDIKSITRRINGGQLGLAVRQAYLVKAKALLNVVDDQGVQQPDPEPAPEVPTVPISVSPDPWYKDPGIVTTGISAASAVPVAFSAQGIAAWALLLLVVAGIGFGIYLIVSKRNAGH